MSLRGPATINIWADDVAAAAGWYAELLGIEPYFERSGPDGHPAYIEFRIGDAQTELGIIDRRYAPPGDTTGPGGVVVHWHVDDLEGTVQRLLDRGASAYQPIMPRGEGFITASVVDPFGNVLGVMHNPHYLDMVAAQPAHPWRRRMRPLGADASALGSLDVQEGEADRDREVLGGPFVWQE